MARKVSASQESKRTYACTNCGHPFDAYPPDDGHTIVMLEPCDKGDSIKIAYECENCHGQNVRYWDIHHFVIATSKGTHVF